MTALLHQLILQLKTMISGATATTVNGLTNVIPSGLIDTSMFTDTTNIAGFTVPTFILYLVLSDD